MYEVPAFGGEKRRQRACPASEVGDPLSLLRSEQGEQQASPRAPHCGISEAVICCVVEVLGFAVPQSSLSSITMSSGTEPASLGGLMPCFPVSDPTISVGAMSAGDRF